jgi:tetratricopeptide (TPR) repeat protein
MNLRNVGAATGSLQPRLQEAEQLLRRGQFKAAETICLIILAEAPQLAPALQILGLSLAQRGDREGAERAFRQYIAIKPNSAAVHTNLGNLYLLKDDAAGVERCYRAALAITPTHPEAHFDLGLALKAQGRFPESLEALNAAIRLRPNYVDALVQSAVVMLAMGNPDAALIGFDQAIALNQDHFEAHFNRGLALDRLDRLEEAKLSLARAAALDQNDYRVFLALGETLRRLRERTLATSALARAAALKPDSAEAHGALARVFFEDGWTNAAVDEIGKAIALDPENPKYHTVNARILADLNRLEEATAANERAVELAPDSLDTLSALGSSHLSVGRAGEARRVFERALALHGDEVRAHLNLARIEQFRLGDGRLTRLESFLSAGSTMAASDRVALHFSLGRAYDELGDYDRAFEHFRTANALQGRDRAINEEEDVIWHERVKAIYSRDFMDARAGSGSPSKVPIFVLGMPRSGSTLIEQIISGHPDVRGAGEVQDFEISTKIVINNHRFKAIMPDLARELSDDALRELGGTYTKRLLQRAPGASRITDKLPGNYSRIGLIRLALPNAAIVHCVRNPIDCCLSIYTNPFAEPLEHANDLGRLGRHYRRYHALMAHWRAVLPEDAFLDVAYEDTVRDLESAARRIIAHCGLEWHPRCLDFQNNRRQVKTISITQVRQPIYTSSVARWRNYEKNLKPLLVALGDLATCTRESCRTELNQAR